MIIRFVLVSIHRFKGCQRSLTRQALGK